MYVKFILALFQGLYLPAHTGMPFGGEDQPGLFVMEVHYDNQMETPGDTMPYLDGFENENVHASFDIYEMHSLSPWPRCHGDYAKAIPCIPVWPLSSLPSAQGHVAWTKSPGTFI